MNKIIALVGPGDKGASVTALHEAMLEIFFRMSDKEYVEVLKQPAFLTQWNDEYTASHYGDATGEAVRIFQQQYMGVQPTGTIDGPTAAAINQLLNQSAKKTEPTVSGTVYDEWIEPLGSATVKAFDQGIRLEQLLGEGKTDAQGQYSISWANRKAAPNLIVKLFSAAGASLYTSPVTYNAPTQLQVNINLGPRGYLGLSEFVTTVELVKTYIGTLTISELTENNTIHDLSFLIGQTGIGVDILLTLVSAFRFEKWSGVQAEVFYGILRNNNAFAESDAADDLPADVDTTIEQAYLDFWTASIDDDMAALRQAAINNTVTYAILKNTTQIQAKLLSVQTSPPQPTGATQPLPPVYANLKTAGLNPAQQQAFLQLSGNAAIDADFWTTLGKDPSFQGDAGTTALGQAQAVFQLATWTGNDASLTASLIQTLSIHSTADFKNLVSKTTADWEQVIGKNGTPAQAESIAANIEKLYPMAVFSDRLAKTANWNIPNRDYLTAIMHDTDFDLSTTTARQYLTTYTIKNPLPKGVPADVVASQLMVMQRVYRISQRSDTSLSLLTSNIQSARQIYTMGQSSFVAQYQQQLGGADKAETIFNQAADIHAAATHLTGQLISRLNNPAGNILPRLTDNIDQSNLAKNYPDLANLFGMAASYCECRDCKSILGIPAYLADILDFLSCRKTTVDIGSQPGNARELLLAIGRRPDIADIDLSCKNTNVELPYIDVVNELLEDYIIPPVTGLKLDFGTEADAIAWFKKNLAQGAITTGLYTELLKIASDPKTPICNISLLTMAATVSDWYVTDDWNFPNTEGWGSVVQYVIRDRYITLKLIVNVVEAAQFGAVSFLPGYQPVLVPLPNDGRINNVLQIIVQEIHETHLSTEVIDTNPEYTNTNVYNCLSLSLPNVWDLYPTLIPVGLPFDLYFTESNVYLNKMGMKRADLIDTFRDQQVDPPTGYTKSIGSIVNAYLGLAQGEVSIIFTADLAGQSKYWGALAGNPTPEVDQFLTISGLSFVELQRLLTLGFINGKGMVSVINDPAIVVNGYSMEDCDISKMTITNMITTSGGEAIDKYDLVNRFLRLWRKVNLITAMSMEELDACIMSGALGKVSLDPAFGIDLYYFLEVMSRMSLSATQVLVFYQPMETGEQGSLYQQLFLNRQVTNPLVDVFQLPSNGSAISIDLTIHPEAIPVILTVCAIGQADLTAILNLINPSNGPLDISMLSFMYACGLLADYLSIGVADLFTFANLTGLNPINKIIPAAAGAVPATTMSFIDKYNDIRQAGFTVDGIDYLLVNESTGAPSLIPSSDMVLSGLLAIRTALQAAVEAATVMPDPQGALLKKWLADPILNWNPGLAASLLSILGTADNEDFISLVRENLVFLQGLAVDYPAASASSPSSGPASSTSPSSNSAWLDRLPPIHFPDATISQIKYDVTNYFLFFNGPMTTLDRTFLSSLPGADTAAINTLFQQSQQSPLAAAALGVASVPNWLTANYATIRLNVPGLTCGLGAIGFTGSMTGAVYNSLLAQSDDPVYGAALSQLFILCQNLPAATTAYVQLASLPTVGLPDENTASLTFSNGMLGFDGAMSAADVQVLLNLSNDQSWQYAICSLFTTTVFGQPVSVPLAALPSGWGSIPDLSGIGGQSYSPAMLTFTGVMTQAQRDTLLAVNVSADPWNSQNFYDAVNALYALSQQGGVSAVPLASLPVGASPGMVAGLDYTLSALNFTGQMSPAVQTALAGVLLPPVTIPLADSVLGTAVYTHGSIVFAGTPNTACNDEFNLQQLNADPDYQTAIGFIYQPSLPSSESALPPGTIGVVLHALPQIVFPEGMSISWSDGFLSFTGQMSAADKSALLALSTVVSYQTAVNELFANSAALVVNTAPLAALPSATLPPAAITAGWFYDAVNLVLYYQGVYAALPAAIATLTNGLNSSDPDLQSVLSIFTSHTTDPGTNIVVFAPPPLTPFADSGIVLSNPGSSISYQGGTLAVTGTLSFADYLALLALSHDPSYRTAVTNLFVGKPATAFGIPAMTIPAIFAKQLSFSAATSTLTLAGGISAGGYSALLSFGSSSSFQKALASIYQGPAASVFPDIFGSLLPQPNGVLTALDVPNRYTYFLNAISPTYQALKEANALAQQLAANLALTMAVATILVSDLPDMESAFTAASFVGNNKPINSDPDQFILASWYVRLTKLAFLIEGFALSAGTTDWLLTNAALIPNVLSKVIHPDPATPPTFADWEQLNDLIVLQRSFGQQITTVVRSAHDLSIAPANPGAVLRQLVQLTGWPMGELLYLLNIAQPNPPNARPNPLDLTDSGNPAIGCAEDLADITILRRLAACFSAAAQLKVVPSRMINWVTDPLTATTAMDIKQALKAQYPDTTSWESAIVPLMNTLRQERRDALVRYLLTNKVTNFFGTFPVFADEFSIYGNFLLDVEMGACQPTTRLIQAYCSVQSFVQRCFLSIEPDISTGTDPEWRQWEWMGRYESWYEARYVFLYPENFILPQALPNPSSFFVDMQNNLTQGPVTTEIVETAFENYIESLDGVARLQVVGMWYDDPTENIYVFARAYGDNPALYYFRVMNALQQWSPWEQVTADVADGQVIPVVQNGRLYLYWPVFTQASDDDNASQAIPTTTSGGSTPPPVKYWQIQMAFSEYRNGKWSGKKMSSDYLSSTPIAVVQGMPVVYPDTTDFVFIALDLATRAAAPADVVRDTQESLRVTNNMSIVCCQYVPDKAKVTIAGYLHGDHPKKHYELILPMNILSHSFKMADLIDKIAKVFDDIAGGFDYEFYMTSNDSISLTDPDKAVSAANLSIINTMNAAATAGKNDGHPLARHHFTVTKISPVPSITGQSDRLTVLSNPAAPSNGFALDPLRGYPTTAKISGIGAVIDDCWFKGGSFDDALCVGGLPLETNGGKTILEGPTLTPPLPITYANLLPLQMGLWAKYAYISGGKPMHNLGTLMPFFYQDSNCTFFVLQATAKPYITYEEAAIAFELLPASGPAPTEFKDILKHSTIVSGPAYQFVNFYHPFAHYFIRIVAEAGMTGVVSRAIQLTGDKTYGANTEVKSNRVAAAGYKDFSFTKAYQPHSNVVNITGSSYTGGYPIQQLDFDLGASYALYNWELFFHGVLLSAMQLSQNRQFAAADACFKLIFNSSDSSHHAVPHKYWETKPFFENAKAQTSIDQLITEFITDPASQVSFGKSVAAWKNDPYDPHRLAMVRITPYMYATFMKYLDNLIAWANQYYTQHTMETVNAAIQLYMLALELLGKKPEAIPPVVKEPVRTYNQLEWELDQEIIAEGAGYLSDPIVQVENLLPGGGSGGSGGTSSGSGKKLPVLSALYFCIPPNEVLLSYWNIIETQLNKIRNCLNIQGQFQPLSPFPNVPGLGGQEGSGVADFGGVLPNYRFSVMIQKATELCQEVKSLGASLLSALEKQDAEGLSLLRASQELAVQQSIDKVRQLQITDAQLALQNLENYHQLVSDKVAYYSGLLQEGLSSLESQALMLNQISLAMQAPIEAGSMITKAVAALPNWTLGMAGFGGSPVATFQEGGSQWGAAADSFVQFMAFTMQFMDKAATLSNINATYERRSAEWSYQLTIANDELAQVNTQIQAANNKIAISTQEEQNQQLMIRNAEDIASFLQSKYTNKQLYSWMVTQISNVYFQSYQLAYSIAKQAEVCFGYELGITGASYIKYGYWDSLHKGLLSGEALMTSLKQMETDYFNFNFREYELTRQISLAQLDPAALLQLKSNGSCFINIPEELFDLDYPGHYFRRVKRVAVTIPGVVGPYTPICLKMTLLSNSVRIDNTAGTSNTYPRHANSKGVPTNDSRFLDNYAAIQYIATSNGVNDGGLFEMNLHDERYLPFERAGAISTWQLEFTSVYPQFDPETITDLIVHFSYTSRDGGTALQSVAAQSVEGKLKSIVTAPGLVLMRGFSARRDFPTQWYKFLNPANSNDPQELDMDITTRFPFFTQGQTIRISTVIVMANIPPGSDGSGGDLPALYLSGQKLNNQQIDFGPNPQFGHDMLYSAISCKDSPGLWKIGSGTGPSNPPVTPAGLNDLFVIFYYSIVNPSS